MYLLTYLLFVIYKIVHRHVSIHSGIAFEVLSDHYKYFTFGSHICLLTSLLAFVFLVWQTYLFLEMPMKFYVTCTNILYLEAIFILSHQ